MPNGLEATNNLTSFLTERKKPTDPTALRTLYGTMDLEKRLGGYGATGQQHRAMFNLLQSEESLGKIKQQIPAVQAGVESLTKLKQMGFGENVNVFAGGEPIEGQVRLTPEGKAERYVSAGAGEEMVWQPTTPELEKTPPLPKGFKPEEKLQQPPAITSDNVNQVQLGSTDITNIINEIGTGEFTTPEMAIGTEQDKLATEEIKTKTAEALSTVQQQMAKRGMAFSSIRSSAEESIAASSLSKLTGLQLDTATRIVKAARDEQDRRLKVIKLQKDAQDASLKSMGYIINPFTGQMEKTLEREKFEEKEPVRFASGGGYYEYDTTTGEIKTLREPTMEPPTSYEEWDLAGGEAGTGRTYADFLADRGETQTERDRALKTSAISKALGEFNKPESKGTDGYLSPDLYMKIRNDYIITIGDVTEFDEVFSPLLEPKTRVKLGVGKIQI